MHSKLEFGVLQDRDLAHASTLKHWTFECSDYHWWVEQTHCLNIWNAPMLQVIFNVSVDSIECFKFMFTRLVRTWARPSKSQQWNYASMGLVASRPRASLAASQTERPTFNLSRRPTVMKRWQRPSYTNRYKLLTWSDAWKAWHQKDPTMPISAP